MGLNLFDPHACQICLAASTSPDGVGIAAGIAVGDARTPAANRVGTGTAVAVCAAGASTSTTTVPDRIRTRSAVIIGYAATATAACGVGITAGVTVGRTIAGTATTSWRVGIAPAVTIGDAIAAAATPATCRICVTSRVAVGRTRRSSAAPCGISRGATIAIGDTATTALSDRICVGARITVGNAAATAMTVPCRVSISTAITVSNSSATSTSPASRGIGVRAAIGIRWAVTAAATPHSGRVIWIRVRVPGGRAAGDDTSRTGHYRCAGDPGQKGSST